MEQLLWGILLILFAIVEGITAGLVSVWFCVGALAALIAAACKAPLLLQIALFIALSLVSMALMRPLACKRLIPHVEATNADRVLGAEGLVTEAIDNLAGTGSVSVSGQPWTARTREDAPIPVGTRVRVCEIQGVKLLVAPLGAAPSPTQKTEVPQA